MTCAYPRHGVHQTSAFLERKGLPRLLHNPPYLHMPWSKLWQLFWAFNFFLGLKWLFLGQSHIPQLWPQKSKWMKIGTTLEWIYDKLVRLSFLQKFSNEISIFFRAVTGTAHFCKRNMYVFKQKVRCIH